MGFIQENVMSISVTDNAEANVTTHWSSGIGECFVHGVQNMINIGATGKTNKPIIYID